MITERRFLKGDARSAALYSPCERYRYALSREWAEGARILYVMLNPSTATETQNDPTVERCERRARTLGYGGFRVCNLFAWRETSPALLKKASEPIGPENDRLLREAADWIGPDGLILCGWGVHGSHMGRGAEVKALLKGTGRRLAHLGLTKDGEPRHPLYVAYATQPTDWV
ncbi:DUF1643 domain-containing protein [Pseudooceanicola sp. CBS1P-1]|uniref:DUF1643 domain-containing protein n=1 Tax=Pseudooceanicola albus TaxID=2692189 RepID=A0A6L7G8W2_9RHOB|nr:MULTISPECIES: DUF1643 domain-containing protein [Pseudooceanicola]MBT9384141.1 DUF1643 domain-containing protein [Pseudooceanicola endophyticus]MXN19760.1 DUF1643 domain-containing protein [Pseudooceanicola albus]